MKNIKKFTLHRVLLSCFVFAFSSCDKYLEVDIDKGQISFENTFNDDKSATSTVYGLYESMVGGAIAGGGQNGVSLLAGLSADELHNVLNTEDYAIYENNELRSEDRKILSLWTSAYRAIYQSNDILEGVESSPGVSAEMKKQLRGEALFCRAFNYFYLVNIFGDVPLTIATDYKLNTKASRTAKKVVYDQIITDLLEAESIMAGVYPESERVRPNRYTAMALLSRVYLYNNEWEKARVQADSVIAQGDYFLEPDLNNVFIPSSQEVIWQLATEQGSRTHDGDVFNIVFGINTATTQLTDDLLNAFTNDDQRIQHWVSLYHNQSNGTDLYYPFKYKVTYISVGLEHFVVLRLAEQYLIRAEANAQLELLNESIDDLDKIRVRSGLDPIGTNNPAVSKEDLLDLIVVERRRELFAEWGHRWFDLKRTNRSTEVLQPIKPGWSANDMLYPVPQSEFNKNPFLGDQNSGY